MKSNRIPPVAPPQLKGPAATTGDPGPPGGLPAAAALRRAGEEQALQPEASEGSRCERGNAVFPAPSRELDVDNTNGEVRCAKAKVSPDDRTTKALGFPTRAQSRVRAVYDLSYTGGGGTEANGKPPDHLGESYPRQRPRSSGSKTVTTAVTQTDYVHGTSRRPDQR